MHVMVGRPAGELVFEWVALHEYPGYGIVGSRVHVINAQARFGIPFMAGELVLIIRVGGIRTSPRHGKSKWVIIVVA